MNTVSLRAAARCTLRARLLGTLGTLCLLGQPACVGPAASPALLDAARDLTGQLAVFPGAEGYGTTTRAGRRGAVLRVTSLASDGPGTLREAVQTPGPRTIVFEVAGTVTIQEPIVFSEPFVSVAGQTAPPPGVTLTGAGIVIATHDVLLQHLRVRPGDSPAGPDPGGRDGLSIDGGPGGALDVHDVVVDHCSFSWAIDEGVGTWNPGVRDVTIRASILAENLSHSLHPKGEHSKGLLVGDHARRVSILGNLFAHNRMRNPFLKGDVSAVIAGNVIYNPGSEAIHLDDPEGSGPTLATIAGNVLLPGPDTAPLLPLVDVLSAVKNTSEVSLFGNDSGRNPLSRPLYLPPVLASIERYAVAPVRVLPLTLLPADLARDAVLARAGARPADRDAVDRRIVAGVTAGTGRIIDSPSEVGGLPETAPQLRPLSLPAADGDADGDGYTDLEEWLHGRSQALIFGAP